MSETDALLPLDRHDRLELGCEISPGGGRVAAYLDDTRLFDREVPAGGSEVAGERLLLPPLPPGQHALRVSVFRTSLDAVARLELLANGESAYHRISRSRDDGLLTHVTLYLDVG